MRTELKSIIEKLESYKEKVNQFLENAQNIENSSVQNDERIERLESETELLEQAIDCLNEIE